MGDIRIRSKSVLFLPFLRIPSGHHQVAKALIEGLQENQQDLCCDVVDILYYSYGRMEDFVSKTYLSWIKAFPQFYSWIYRRNVYTNLSEDKRFLIYELLFLPFMRKLLEENKPELIVCTHALPSYLLNFLKERGEISTPVINVYTDYFIHNLWGIRHIDYHFTPIDDTKEYLMKKGVKGDQIFLTGIPIHDKIQKIFEPKRIVPSTQIKIIITGGNLGVGAIDDIVGKIEGNDLFHFYILCGTNQALFQKINKLNKCNITPVEYIECRQKMNDLYDQIDAIVTKPGGVTVSESIFKGKPIFIYHALPGQEEINLKKLENMGLAVNLQGWKDDTNSLESQLTRFFQDRNKVNSFQNKLKEYHEKIEKRSPAEIIHELLEVVARI